MDIERMLRNATERLAEIRTSSGLNQIISCWIIFTHLTLK